jgi:hypothetical protein
MPFVIPPPIIFWMAEQIFTKPDLTDSLWLHQLQFQYINSL